MSNDPILSEHASGHSAQDHFVNAVEFMHMATESQDPAVAFWRPHRLAKASIVEAFLGVECETNEIGYNCFVDTSSAQYVAEDPANIPLRILRQSWDRNLNFVEKVRWVLSHLGGALEPKMEMRLRELLTLRNWLVHGFIFRSTYLLEQVDDSTWNTVDRQDSVNWKTRFPNLKFNPLDLLAATDAQTAVRVAFEFLQLVRTLTGTVEHIVYVKGGVARFYEARAGASIDELILGNSPTVADVVAAMLSS